MSRQAIIKPAGIACRVFSPVTDENTIHALILSWVRLIGDTGAVTLRADATDSDDPQFRELRYQISDPAPEWYAIGLAGRTERRARIYARPVASGGLFVRQFAEENVSPVEFDGFLPHSLNLH